MTKMFLITRDSGMFVLREARRALDRNTNVAHITFVLEPMFGAPVTLQQRNELGIEFYFEIFEPDEWQLIRKDCSQETVIALIDSEVQVCKSEMREPRKYTEIVNFLLTHDYEIINIEEDK